MSSVWREESSEDTAQKADEALVELVGALAASEAPTMLRSSTGEFALVISWPALAAGSSLVALFDASKASFNRVAFVAVEASQEARGLLRYCDLVAIPREVEDEPVEAPEGLLCCGQITLRDADVSTERIDLFVVAPVDRGLLMGDAPIEIDEPEDLDAREDWFKKRHESTPEE